MSKIKPLNNRVLIKREKKTSTKGGILLPESAQEKPKQGVIVAAGPGKLNDDGKLEPMNVSIGDLVLFSSYAGTEVQDQSDAEDYLIMAEDDILGVLN